MQSGVIFIAGLRGSGKTYRIRQLITRNVARNRRVICFDPTGDISEGLKLHYAPHRGGARSFVETFNSVAELRRRMEKPGALDPPIPPIACVIIPGRKLRLFAPEGKAFRDLVLDKASDGNVWVSDEAELVFYGHGQSSPVFPIVIVARNIGALFIVACKDPVRVSMDLRRGADAALIFSLKTDESCVALKDVINPRMVHEAQNLKRREFLYAPPTTDDSVRQATYRLGPDDDLPDEL